MSRDRAEEIKELLADEERQLLVSISKGLVPDTAETVSSLWHLIDLRLVRVERLGGRFNVVATRLGRAVADRTVR